MEDSKTQTKKEGETSTGSSQSSSSSPVPSAAAPANEEAATTTQAQRKKNKTKQKSKRKEYCEDRELEPSPYFYYIDHSRDLDDDPLSSLSPALSVPTFVIKLHAILIRDSLSGVIEWMPHGRSWKILNQVPFLFTASFLFYIGSIV